VTRRPIFIIGATLLVLASCASATVRSTSRRPSVWPVSEVKPWSEGDPDASALIGEPEGAFPLDAGSSTAMLATSKKGQVIEFGHFDRDSEVLAVPGAGLQAGTSSWTETPSGDTLLGGLSARDPSHFVWYQVSSWSAPRIELKGEAKLSYIPTEAVLRSTEQGNFLVLTIAKPEGTSISVCWLGGRLACAAPVTSIDPQSEISVSGAPNDLWVTSLETNCSFKAWIVDGATLKLTQVLAAMPDFEEGRCHSIHSSTSTAVADDHLAIAASVSTGAQSSVFVWSVRSDGVASEPLANYSTGRHLLILPAQSAPNPRFLVADWVEHSTGVAASYDGDLITVNLARLPWRSGVALTSSTVGTIGATSACSEDVDWFVDTRWGQAAFCDGKLQTSGSSPYASYTMANASWTWRTRDESQDLDPRFLPVTIGARRDGLDAAISGRMLRFKRSKPITALAETTGPTAVLSTGGQVGLALGAGSGSNPSLRMTADETWVSMGGRFPVGGRILERNGWLGIAQSSGEESTLWLGHAKSGFEQVLDARGAGTAGMCAGEDDDVAAVQIAGGRWRSVYLRPGSSGTDSQVGDWSELPDSVEPLSSCVVVGSTIALIAFDHSRRALVALGPGGIAVLASAHELPSCWSKLVTTDSPAGETVIVISDPCGRPDGTEVLRIDSAQTVESILWFEGVRAVDPIRVDRSGCGLAGIGLSRGREAFVSADLC